jgi:hypothetical protein
MMARGYSSSHQLNLGIILATKNLESHDPRTPVLEKLLERGEMRSHKARNKSASMPCGRQTPASQPRTGWRRHMENLSTVHPSPEEETPTARLIPAASTALAPHQGPLNPTD